MFDFERAIREQIRFSYKGLLSVEDLWELSQTELNEVYLPLQRELETAERGSLLGDKPKASGLIQYKIDLLKYIATTKKEEADKKKELAERKKKKDKLLELLEAKQNSDLQGKSVEELQKLIEELG